MDVICKMGLVSLVVLLNYAMSFASTKTVLTSISGRIDDSSAFNQALMAVETQPPISVYLSDSNVYFWEGENCQLMLAARPGEYQITVARNNIKVCIDTECKEFHVSIPEQSVIQPNHSLVRRRLQSTNCYGGCETCDEDNSSDYHDCTTCDGTASGIGISITGSYVYCANYCPNGQTSTGVACSGTLGMVFETTFHNLADSWTNNSITLASNGALPAKDRGYYFNGIGSTRMNFTNDFALNLAFTVSAWINTGTATDRVIFSKDDNATDPTTVFVFKIQSDDNLAVEITTPGNFATRETEAVTVSLGSDTWYFVAAGVRLNTDASTAEVRIYQQTDVAIHTTSSSYYYLDDATAYKAVVGAERTSDLSTYRNLFTGFVYGIWIENVYQTGDPRDQIYQGGSCTAAACLVTSTDGVVNFPFNQSTDGTPCHSSCDGKSWMNEKECQTCTWAHCHLCFDAEWTACTGYAAGEWSTCGQTVYSTGTTSCSCSGSTARLGNDTSLLCSWVEGFYAKDLSWAACSQSCKTCVGPDLDNWLSCSDQNATVVSTSVCKCADGYYDQDLTDIVAWDIWDATWATCSNNGSKDWTSCVGSYLTPSGSCESECPIGYYSDDQNVCQPCHETWSTCLSAGSDGCVTWIEGWKRRTGDIASSDCVCDMHYLDNATVSLQIQCTNNPISVANDPKQQQLDKIQIIASNPELIMHDLWLIFVAVKQIQFDSFSQIDEFNEAINKAWVVAMENSDISEWGWSSDNLEVYWERGNAVSFNGADFLTNSGSGLKLSTLDDVVESGDSVQFNVISYKELPVQTNDTTTGTTVSVESYYLEQTHTIQPLELKNLTNNVTIIFDGLDIQPIESEWQDVCNPQIPDFACVYLDSNGTWSSEGCTKTTQSDSTIECSWNHLSIFSYQDALSSAAVDTNIGSTISSENIENFDIKHTYVAIVTMSTIYGLYVVGLWIFRKIEKNKTQMDDVQKLETANTDRTTQPETMQADLARIKWGQNRVPSNDNHTNVYEANVPGNSRDSYSVIKEENSIDCDSSSMGSDDVQDAQIQPIDASYNDVVGTDLMRQDECIQPSSIDSPPPHETSQEQSSSSDASSQQPVEAQGNLTRRATVLEAFESFRSSSFGSRFIKEHKVFALWEKPGETTGIEKLTIVFVVIIMELYAVGLFLDFDESSDQEDTESDDETMEQSITHTTWTDLWIMLYTLCVVFPVPLVLSQLFTRAKINPDMDDGDYTKLKRNQNIKCTIAYTICAIVCVYCTWSIILFSNEFGRNKSNNWLIVFFISFVFDAFVKDTILSILFALWAIYGTTLFGRLLSRCKKRKFEVKIEVDSPVTAKSEENTSNKIMPTMDPQDPYGGS